MRRPSSPVPRHQPDRRLLRRAALVATAALLAGALGACEEASGGSAETSSAGDGGGDATSVDWDPTDGDDATGDGMTTTTPAPAALAFLASAGDDGLPCVSPDDRCAVHLAHDEQREIAVAWQLEHGPLTDQVVKFGIVVDDDELGFISALSAYTGSDGVAAVTVGTSRAESGQFTVKATVADPDVAPLGCESRAVIAISDEGHECVRCFADLFRIFPYFLF